MLYKTLNHSYGLGDHFGGRPSFLGFSFFELDPATRITQIQATSLQIQATSFPLESSSLVKGFFVRHKMSQGLWLCVDQYLTTRQGRGTTAQDLLSIVLRAWTNDIGRAEIF